MRRMIPQNLIDFVKKLATLIGFSGNKIEVGNDLEVDGKLDVNSETKFHDHVSVFEGDERFVDINTNNKTSSFYRHVKLGSAETECDLDLNNTPLKIGGELGAEGKIIKIDANGKPTFADEGGGGTKLYKHKISVYYQGGTSIYIAISKNNAQITSNSLFYTSLQNDEIIQFNLYKGLSVFISSSMGNPIVQRWNSTNNTFESDSTFSNGTFTDVVSDF